MTSAMFADSIMGGWQAVKPHGLWGYTHFFFAWIDMTLTSSIGLSFAFIGLSDIGKLDEHSSTAWRIMISCYASLAAAWLWSLWTFWYWGFPILYLLVILVSCTFYLFCELYYLYKVNHQGLAWFLGTGASGFLGIYCLGFLPLRLCELLTPWWGNNEWWFFFSNAAVYSCYRYFIANRGSNIARLSSKRREELEMATLAVPVSSPSSAQVSLQPVFVPRS